MDTAAAKLVKLVNVDEAQARRLAQLAFDNKQGIVMRPVGEGAPKLRAEGYSPKPLAIKWKTCNKVDVEIGAPAGCEGALVLFKPHLPVSWPADPVKRKIMENRIAQRLAEWQDARVRDHAVEWGVTGDFARIYRDDKCHKAAKPEPGCLVGYRSADGLIRDAANDKPFTGDLDLFDITDAGGTQIPTGDPLKNKIVSTMIADGGLDVLHPVHVDWDTSATTDPAKLKKLEAIRLLILDVHRERPESSPKREPLVVVQADCTVCQAWAQPHEKDPFASAADKAGAWKYTCIAAEKVDLNSPRHKDWNPPGESRAPVDLHGAGMAPLRYKKGDALYIKPRIGAPDASCFAITITQATRYADGGGSYEFKNASGGVSGDYAPTLHGRVCKGPPPVKQRAMMPVDTVLRIKSGPTSPDSDCFTITITKATAYSDGTGAYEYKNDGGGVSGDDAGSLEARRCH